MGLATYTYNRSTSGGEIIRELVNASDGQGLHFDGAAGCIDIASPPDLGTKFSFEFIVQQDENADNYLVDFDGALTSRFIIGRSGGNLSVYSSTATFWVSFGVAPLDDNEVHHLVVTVDGTSAIAYDNGNQIASKTISSAHLIDSATDAKIGSSYDASSDFFNGTIYRARFWNKTLSQADVTASYENATVPFADQYGSQTTINSGTTTSGLGYRITARDGVDFTTVGAEDNNVGTEFVATGSVTLDANDTVVRIGAVADYDLAFANPTQSDQVQDRAGAADGTSSASGVTQVTPIEQLNATAARIGSAAQTPADGQAVIDSVLVTDTSDSGFDGGLSVWRSAATSKVGYINCRGGAFNINAPDAYSTKFRNNGGGELLTIDSAGNVGVGGAPASEAGGTTVHIAETGGTNSAVLNLTGGSGGDGSFTGQIQFNDKDDTDERLAMIGGSQSGVGTPPGGKLHFYTQANAGALAERLTIDSAGLTTVTNPGWPLKNELTNSAFSVWSNSTLEDVGTQITVSDVTSGVCTTTETEGLAVGKLFKFNAGDFNSEVFEITALTDDTSFTLNDTSKSDSGTPGTGYEVTPGCVDGNSKAFDGWDKNGSSQYGDIWRQHNDATLTHDGSFYSLKMTSHAASTMQVYSKPSYPFTDSINLQKYAGRTVTMGAWVYVSDSSTPSVFINDTTLPWTGMDSSDIHSGATGWEWLEVTKTISASPGLFVTGVNQIANKTCYISSPILVLGSAIGSGNYSRPSGEIVWCESQFSSKLVANGYSNVNSTSLNLEADSDGKIPKGAKAVHAWLQIRDSDPSGETETRMQITGLNGSPTLQTYVAGLPAVSNGCIRSSAGFVGCTSDGDVDYVIDASGDSTLDITGLRYNAVQLR